jgi:hypothetical protein
MSARPPRDVAPTAAQPGAAEAPAEPDDGESRAYLARVLAEIDEEVRARRGALPASEERELDALFLEHAPMGSRAGDLEAALQLVDRHAFIDPVVPVGSQLVAGTLVKRGVRSASLWYVGYVTHQVSQLGAAVSRSLHIVEGHLEEIRRRLPPEVEAPLVEPGEAGAWWSEVALRALADAKGRVLHAACGDGWLVRELRACGSDAYGVDPREGVTTGAELAGADLREERVLDHLRAVSRDGLGGLVLSGVVEGTGPSERRELLHLLDGTVGPGGVAVVHSLTPSAWFAQDAPVEADLAPGRPVRAATWERLLEGWSVEAHAGPDGRDYVVVATR